MKIEFEMLNLMEVYVISKYFISLNDEGNSVCIILSSLYGNLECQTFLSSYSLGSLYLI